MINKKISMDRELVTPAGGEPEVLSYLYRHPSGDPSPRTYKDRQYGMTDWVETELVDRAHVTRLQAEVERLGKRIEEEVATAISNELKSERDVLTLQSELTKARELNSAAADELHQANVRVILAEEQLAQYQCRHEWIDNGEDLLVCPKCGKEDSGPDPFGWVQTSGPSINRFTQEWDVVEEWSDNGYEWVELFTTEANQSAPADKGQGEAVAYRWRVKGHGEWTTSVCKVEFDARANDDRFVAQALYAEQPAPVAVVMPDFDTWYVKNRGVIGTAIYKNERKVWNACLDEFARLNSEPKP